MVLISFRYIEINYVANANVCIIGTSTVVVDGEERELWLWQEVICVAVCTGLRGHKFAINVIDSVSTELVATGSFDSTIKLWTLKGTHVATLTGHSASITAMKVCMCFHSHVPKCQNTFRPERGVFYCYC